MFSEYVEVLTRAPPKLNEPDSVRGLMIAFAFYLDHGVEIRGMHDQVFLSLSLSRELPGHEDSKLGHVVLLGFADFPSLVKVLRPTH